MKKKMLLVLLSVIMVFSMLFGISACAHDDNIVKYTYTNSQGETSYFEINFDKEEYTYSGNACYREGWGYMLIPNTRFEVSGNIRLDYKMNGYTVYKFSNHPWNYQYPMGITSDGNILRVQWGTFLYYDFVKEGYLQDENSGNNSNNNDENSNNNSEQQETTQTSYSIHYFVNDNSFGSITGEVSQTIKSYQSGTTVTAVAKDGYRFIGWSDGVTSATRREQNVNSDIEVTANFVAANGEQGGQPGGTSGDNEQGGQSGGISGDNNQEDGNSDAPEDDNQDNATQDYELVYVYSEKLQGYSVVGINMNSESETLFDVTIPSTYRSVAVKGIDDKAFAYCRALKSVTIENGITIIGQSAFAGCTSLINVKLPNSINKLVDAAGADPFMDCSSLKHNIKDGLKYLGSSDNPYLYLRGRADGRVITSATIDDNCKIIGGSAFYNCSSLTGIVIPERLVSIDDYAFAGCYSLTSIVIPDSVTSIGIGAFYECSSLTTVTIGNSVTSIGINAFQYCSLLTSIVIPDSVTSIGSSAFCECSSLTTVTIGNSVTSIGYEAFSGCDSLTSVAIPDSVTSIGSYAFYSCSSLTSIVIPDSVTSISYYAFYDCDSLTSVVIGNSVTWIDARAFAYCSSLISIKYRGTQSQWSAISKGSYWDDNTGYYTITYNYTGN